MTGPPPQQPFVAPARLTGVRMPNLPEDQLHLPLRHCLPGGEPEGGQTAPHPHPGRQPGHLLSVLQRSASRTAAVPEGHPTHVVPPGVPPLNLRNTDHPVAPPQWCENAQNRLLATRTQACRIDGVIYRTWVERNGTRTQTGGVDIIINYSYGSTSESRIAHQVDVTAPKGWGDVLKGSYTGNARDGYACTKESGSFPAKPIQPLSKWHTGEAFFDSTATASGAVGECASGWGLTFSTPGYPRRTTSTPPSTSSGATTTQPAGQNQGASSPGTHRPCNTARPSILNWLPTSHGRRHLDCRVQPSKLR